MATEIRFKEDMRMMSPARDLKHCLKPMFKGATELTELHYQGNIPKLQELAKLCLVIITGMNDAKVPDKGTAMDVILQVFKETHQVDPEVRSVLFQNFALVVMCRYITGMRETNTVDQLKDQDIVDTSVCSGIAASLPKWLRRLFAWSMRIKSKWGLLDKTAAECFEIVEVDDIPEYAVKTEWEKIKHDNEQRNSS